MKWDVKRYERVARLRKEGKTFSEIGKLLNVSARRVGRMAKLLETRKNLWTYDLSAHAADLTVRMGFTSKDQVALAIVKGTFCVKNTPNMGRAFFTEICNWAGVSVPEKLVTIQTELRNLYVALGGELPVTTDSIRRLYPTTENSLWHTNANDRFGNVMCKTCGKIQSPDFKACVQCCPHTKLKIETYWDAGWRLSAKCVTCGVDDFNPETLIENYSIVKSESL